jgi:8-oxo-dGTP pyrophosphatase MutT (NUDIX family)
MEPILLHKHSAPQKKAAVIVLHELASDSLILTLRSAELHDHPGEVCFPGGTWQVGDGSLYNTALRELQEELSIGAERVQLVKAMTPVPTLTGFIIHPWLAAIDTLSPYQMDSREVSEVLRIPIKEVCQAANYQEIKVRRYGRIIKGYQYTATPYFIWGATVRIMMQLLR